MLAHALDGAGKPQLFHYLIQRESGAWDLIDVRDVARSCGAKLPRELDLVYFSDAWATRLAAVSNWIARHGIEHTQPSA